MCILQISCNVEAKSVESVSVVHVFHDRCMTVEILNNLNDSDFGVSDVLFTKKPAVRLFHLL